MKIDLFYLRILGSLEATSLLILLFIAMPTRAFTGDTDFVKVMGQAHGVLFLMYLYTALTIALDHKWGLKYWFLAVLYSCLPFGPWIFQSKMDNSK